MRSNILAFAIGIGLLQMQATLPALSLLAGLLCWLRWSCSGLAAGSPGWRG
jgi:hypothetical protein